MNKDWLEDFNTKGFVVFQSKPLVNLIDIDGFSMKYEGEMLRDNNAEDLPELINRQLEMAAVILQEDFINEMFEESEFIKYIVWEGVDADSAAWHNDGFEGMNAFFLIYFDDMSEETGGAVHFKRGEIENTVYPKRGDLILLNQAQGYFHRAEKATIPRRQASFDYMVK